MCPSPFAAPRHPAEDFVTRLAADALRHRAVRHPYLQALAAGTLPDLRWALGDFARHYYGYSSHFPRYLMTVIARLESPHQRAALLANLTEESGVYSDDDLQQLAAAGIQSEWIVGVPHPQLFRRFATALGVHWDGNGESDQVICWRELFLLLLAHGSPAEALGALGLGTENIVRTIYAPLVQAIDQLADLDPRDTVFFPLHTAIDDQHKATLLTIAADFADSDPGRAGVRRGMLKALQLRATFWDWLYDRAVYPLHADLVL